MGNRAYLYFCDDISALRFRSHYEKPDGSERAYMDSRHAFPLAWWLFFDREGVLLIHEHPEYPDLYLARDWELAKADFLRRVPMLCAWLPQISARDIETFLGWVESLQETSDELFLVVDPSELEIEDTHEAQIIAELVALDDEALSVSEKYALISKRSFGETPADLDKLRNQVFGYFYGPPLRGYFQHCLSWPDENDG